VGGYKQKTLNLISIITSSYYLILHCSNKGQKEGYRINLLMHNIKEPYNGTYISLQDILETPINKEDIMAKLMLESIPQ
jgi:hypothetical protein